MQLTRAIIEKWAGPEVFDEAEERVRHGAVMKAEVSGNVISGLFARTAAPPVKCEFTVNDDGTVESRCPCEKHERYGLICLHVVALAISVMERLADPARQQRYLEEQRHARRIQDALAVSFRRIPHGGVPARLLLELPRDFTAQFMSGAVAIRLIVMTGSPEQPCLIENLPREKPLTFPEEDDTVLDVLEDVAEAGLKSTLELNRIDFLGLLDVCRGRTLFLAGGDRIEVSQTTARLTVKAGLDPKTGELNLKPYVDCGEAVAHRRHHRRPAPLFMAELEKSFAIFDGKLWPLKPTLPLPYHQIYHEHISVPRSGIPSFVASELPRLSTTLPFSFAEGFSPDIFTTSPGKPKFGLTLSGDPESISARLVATYGTKTVVACSPEIPGEVMEPDPDDLYAWFVRDMAAEQRALARLTANGFLGPQGDALAPITGRRRVLNILGGLVPPLRRLGWSVNVTGVLGKFLDDAPMAIPVVKVDSRNADTGQFEVTISFEDGKRHKIPQPAIQQTLNKGDAFFDFGGTCILVDRDAVESMRGVFNDCGSRPGKRPGSFQLPEVFAPYVESSLAALDGIDVELPQAWRKRARQCNRDERLTPEPIGVVEKILRPYQKMGVYWMRFLERGGFCGILADEMGLGKARQTLAWLSMTRIDVTTRGQPALVVAPTSLVENWRREAEKFTPGRRCLVMQGPDRHALWDQIPSADIVITSYALLRRDLDNYAGLSFSVAILDEAQNIKNRSTQNATAVKTLRARSRLVLTGTPVENGVADIWSIMDFLMPGYLGGYEQFRERYEIPISSSGPQCEEAQARLHKRLRPFLLRRLKQDVAKDLPEKIQQVVFSALAPEQAKLYSTLRERFLAKISALVAERGFEKCRMDILALLLRLRQACCHPSLLPQDLLGDTPADASSGKLEQFLEILDEARAGGHRMLVFSQFVGMLTVLRQTLDAQGVKYCYLDGSTKDRLAECRRFNQTPSIPVFLISLKAGGTGLNLTGADMVVHFDPWWNPAVEDQATDRAHRIGQKRRVTSVKLIAEGTVEERVLEMQRKKQSVIQATIGTDDAAFMQSLTWKDIQDLLA
jgi:superfamily II DNA or RNA helicase